MSGAMDHAALHSQVSSAFRQSNRPCAEIGSLQIYKTATTKFVTRNGIPEIRPKPPTTQARFKLPRPSQIPLLMAGHFEKFRNIPLNNCAFVKHIAWRCMQMPRWHGCPRNRIQPAEEIGKRERPLHCPTGSARCRFPDIAIR